MTESREKIAEEDEIPDDGTYLFTLLNTDGEEVEAVLVDTDAGIRCWENYCRHWTDVRLDRGDGGSVRNGEILCQKHGAIFDKSSGRCTYGPCEGSSLVRVEIDVDDGDVYLTDPDYGFVDKGGVEREEEELSRGSRGGLDF